MADENFIPQIVEMDNAYPDYAGWIAEDGSYGTSDIIIFKESDLTGEQWEIYNKMSEQDLDTEMYKFVKACIKGEDISQWKEMVE